jgi:hypothetical protein
MPQVSILKHLRLSNMVIPSLDDGVHEIPICLFHHKLSRFNRSFGSHRQNDSNASSSSVALSYARHGADTGMAAWTHHRKEGLPGRPQTQSTIHSK